jgi:hypothetical protein
MKTSVFVALFAILIAGALGGKTGHGIGVGLSSFSSAISAAPLVTKEFVVFNYTVPVDSDYGMITHWWATGVYYVAWLTKKD